MKNDLNKLLADIAVLKQKAYTLHWNVKGKTFMAYHKLTEALYEGLIGLFDEVAEKIIINNKLPFGTLAEYIKNSSLEEIKSKNYSTEEVVEIIIKDIKTVKETVMSIKATPSSQPILDEVLMFLDKQEWFFNASK